MRSMHLEPDEYFVLGDNRDRSNDSRMIGPIAKSATLSWPRFEP
jgi:type IV secretory pathway protease TraF